MMDFINPFAADFDPWAVGLQLLGLLLAAKTVWLLPDHLLALIFGRLKK
jgi:hypothetical protein